MVVAEILANQLATWRANSVDAGGPLGLTTFAAIFEQQSQQTSGDSTRMNKSSR